MSWPKDGLCACAECGQRVDGLTNHQCRLIQVDGEGHWVKSSSAPNTPVCTAMMLNPRAYFGCEEDCPECARKRVETP